MDARRLIFTSAVALVGMAATMAAATTVTLNPALTYQTIEGWGTMVKRDVGIGDSVDLRDAAYRAYLHDSLGVNVLRMWNPPAFEDVNDNGDPASLNRSGFNYNGNQYGSMRWICYVINQMKSYNDMKFIISVLSPPAWMKDNNSEQNGGHVLEAMRPELAEYLVAMYRTIKDSTGVDLYGISLQNEPEFAEWYSSCVYTGAEYIATLKVVGARFAQEGINVKFHGADDMVGTPNYTRAIINDTGAVKYMNAFSVHGYLDGVSPAPASMVAQAWSAIYGRASAKGLRTWMTEVSGWPQDSALTPALQIGTAIKSGNASMWLYLAPNDCSVSGLLCNRQATGISSAHRQFYRWVKPGAVRIDAAYTDSHLLISVFRHVANKTLTIVAVNDTTVAIPLTLQGGSLPATMRKYSTHSPAPVKLCHDDGDVSTNAAVTIDAQNVVTLYGANYDPIVSVVRPASESGARSASAALLARPRSALSFGIDGRVRRVGRASRSGICFSRPDGVGSTNVKRTAVTGK
jgi:glucuronoarabinoxylan endo-1,4-beta-xylanase